MNSTQRALAAIAVGGIAWGLASLWCANPSECFYIAIPPVALVILLSGFSDMREAMRTRLRPGLACAAGLLVTGVGLASLFLGPIAVFSARYWVEIGAALYFLTGVVIVLLSVHRLLRAAARSVFVRWRDSRALRLMSCELLPLALFLLFALPYGVAFSNVHRFKMPNWDNPKRFLGKPYVDVDFMSADGTALRGWWIPAKKPSTRTLVFIHGIAGNRTVVLPFAETGDWLEANVFMIDLRGHGDSGGRTVTLGCREKDDILAAIAHVRREHPSECEQVVGMGTSLGAASMALAAAEVEPPLDGVILDSCFTSSQDMTHAVLGTFPRVSHGWLLALAVPMADWHAGCPMMKVNPEASIDRLRAPVLFLHSRGDPLIPSEHARRLYERAVEPKRLRLFDLNGHCDAFFAQREYYHDEIDFFTNCLRMMTFSCER